MMGGKKFEKKESYAHKMAKELYYAQVNKETTMIDRTMWIMEFPCVPPTGFYPDEMRCKFPGGGRHMSDKLSVVEIEDGMRQVVSRFKMPDGSCKCAHCKYMDFNGVIVHDIAQIGKGGVYRAIEIIHSHPPDWEETIDLDYPVELITTQSILGRVSDTEAHVFRTIPPFNSSRVAKELERKKSLVPWGRTEICEKCFERTGKRFTLVESDDEMSSVDNGDGTIDYVLVCPNCKNELPTKKYEVLVDFM